MNNHFVSVTFKKFVNTIIQRLLRVRIPGEVIPIAYFLAPGFVFWYSSLNYYHDLFRSSLSASVGGVEVFDFIVVGGGSSGAVVANRLSRHHRVLLLEAGGDPNPLAYVPVASPILLNRSPIDWRHKTVPQINSSLGLIDHVARFPRGNGLGGSSVLNSSAHGTGGPIHDEKLRFAPGVEYWLNAGQELGYEIPGQPLILTPFLESGQADKAREFSQVHNLTNLKSFFGFFTTDKKGPGAATMFGLFVENGPFNVDSDGNIDYRTTSWALSHSFLFIDNPVGAGFSFTKDKRGYATAEVQITDGLYNVLNQFYQLFPDQNQKQRNLYITGESYAGIAVGDGFTDPFSEAHFGTFLYNLGFVDRIGRKHLEVQELTIRNLIVKGKYYEAFQEFDRMLGFTIGHKNGTVFKLTALEQYYNFLLISDPPAFSNRVNFLDKNNATRKSLHVASQPYTEYSLLVMRTLENDMLRSCKSSVEKLLNTKIYKVLLYNGQLDIIVSPLAMNTYLERLSWYGAEDFANTKKTIWKVNGEVAGYGYRKQFGNFTHLVIRNAGHIVPFDQPEWALKMINEFILSE